MRFSKFYTYKFSYYLKITININSLPKIVNLGFLKIQVEIEKIIKKQRFLSYFLRKELENFLGIHKKTLICLVMLISLPSNIFELAQ